MILAAFIVYYLVDNLDFWLWPSIRHGHVTCLSSHSCRLIRLFGDFDWQCWDSQCELATESRSAMDPWQFIFGQSGKTWLSFFQKQVGICQKTILLGSSKVLKSFFLLFPFYLWNLLWLCFWVSTKKLRQTPVVFGTACTKASFSTLSRIGFANSKAIPGSLYSGYYSAHRAAEWETMG